MSLWDCDWQPNNREAGLLKNIKQVKRLKFYAYGIVDVLMILDLIFYSTVSKFVLWTYFASMKSNKDDSMISKTSLQVHSLTSWN